MTWKKEFLMPTNIEIILASSSPRRRELLSKTKYKFKVISPSHKEQIKYNESINDYLIRNVKGKAQSVMRDICKETQSTHIFISADTIVTLEKQLFEKPKNRENAKHMLSILSGKTHEVITTYGCFLGHREIINSVRSYVRFSHISQDTIDWYLDQNEFIDKSGAYSAQSYASSFIENIVGSYTNIIGLPLNHLCKTLEELLAS